jgi:nickel/cobalt transporter (NicO) family protein
VTWSNRRTALLLCAAAAFAAVLGVPAPAQAHPLGNFSVNHYHGLRLYPDHIEDTAVLDEAEIPTLQDRANVDSNSDGAVAAQEQSAFAATTCLAIAGGLRTTVDGNAVAWKVTASAFAYRAGAANLPTGRTECTLRADVDLRKNAVVNVTDTYRVDRVGWHEYTASGNHVTLTNPPVGTASVSDELRRYPNDLLASPLDQRTVRLTTAPGDGRTDPAPTLNLPGAGPFTRALAAVTGKFNDIVGSPHLTPVVGLLGVVLALILGSAHAALPGHGKTVMAAYIAGRRGSTRDAVTVGVTVTATHTSGVLVLGLLLTLVTGLVGETLLGWLGAVSGLLIAAIGATLLKAAVSNRPGRRDAESTLDRPATPQLVVSGVRPDNAGTAPAELPTHDEHRHHHHGHPHALHHDHHHHHHHQHRLPPLGRRGLIGMGVAGGLVPSPSALIVLLGAVALGRTWFGVLLVVAYGAGMAVTLTAAGLLLVRLRNGLDTALAQRVGRWSGALAAATPIITAALVLLVGLSMALRSVLPVLPTG